MVYTKDEGKPKQPDTPSNSRPESVPQLSDMKLLEDIATPSRLLPYYSSMALPPSTVEYLSKMGNAAQKSTVRNMSLAEAVYTVYSSCQGEVNEESFFRLLLACGHETAVFVLTSPPCISSMTKKKYLSSS